MLSLIEKWTNYRDTRRGDYAFRAGTRYKAVADHLFRMGLTDADAVLDVGAGTCQFGKYLRERGFHGLYLPIDAVLDGTDLETWAPDFRASFVTCIETLEHVHDWGRLLRVLMRAATRGTVLTTPNPDAVDVLKCDPTHVSIVYPWVLSAYGFTLERHSWFGVPEDTLLAWRQDA